jgi:hypothetical protein
VAVGAECLLVAGFGCAQPAEMPCLLRRVSASLNPRSVGFDEVVLRYNLKYS